MSLQSIPEALLYALLPEGVIEKDQRGLLEAVISGYQDRVEDLRSAVGRYEAFLDPQQTTPEGPSNSLLVTLTGPQGGVISRSVEADDTTPDDTAQDELKAWVTARLEIEGGLIISVARASDPLRVIDTNLLEYLASTIGAVIYKTDVTVGSVSRQRQIVESYFPRLKVKGTAISFEVLGRLLGFDDVQYTPLWGRVTPRLPNDPGAAINSSDFSSFAQSSPTAVVSIFYDPNKLNDGPYYQWVSGTLVNSPSDPDYFTSVNALNPFIIIKATGTTAPPGLGSYVLEGGGPHAKANASPPGSGLTFEALAEGDSFNGLSVVVTATGSNLASRQLSVVDRLSAIKYRTSYYNLALFSDLDTLADGAIIGIKKNKDLEATPALVSGTLFPATSPFFPYSSGTQVIIGTEQLDYEALVGLGAQAAAHFEEVRAATRFPRRFSVGYTALDSAVYAAFRSRTDLFTTNNTGAYSGLATGFPDAPYYTGIAVQAQQEEQATRATVLDSALTAILTRVPERGTIILLQGLTIVGGDDGQGQVVSLDPSVVGGSIDYVTRRLRVIVSTQALSLTVRYQALTLLSAEFDAINAFLVNFSGSGIGGNYNFSTGSFFFVEQGAGLQNGKVVAALWNPASTDIIRDEPSGTYKFLGYTNYQARPEDYLDLLSVQAGTIAGTVFDVPGLFGVVSDTFTELGVTSLGGFLSVVGAVGANSILTTELGATSIGGLLGLGSHGATSFSSNTVVSVLSPMHHQIDDEYAWRRPITAGGELVDANFYQPPTADLKTRAVDDVMVIIDQDGVEHDIIGLDDFDGRGTPIRTIFYDRESSVELYRPGNLAIAVDSSGTNFYHAGLVQGVMVADPTLFFHPSHRDGLVGWLLFNEHPDDDLGVVDHSHVSSAQVLLGVLPESRAWDAAQGWHLYMRRGMAITSEKDRGLSTRASLSFRIRPYDIGTQVEESTIFTYGPVSFDLSPQLSSLTAYVLNKDNVRVKAAVLALFPGWTFITLRASGGALNFRSRSASVIPAEISAPVGHYVDFSTATLEIRCDDAQFGINDLKIWSSLKPLADLDRVFQPPRTATPVVYGRHYFLTAGLQERWGLAVLDSGLVVPYVSAAGLEMTTEQQQMVLRYGDDARYTGDLRFKEVGLGGGQLPPNAWQVGNRIYPVLASGDIVISTSHATMPGVNKVWDSLFGGVGTLFEGGLISPGVMRHANPIQERIWVEGDDKAMYEVVADDDGTKPLLVARPFYQDREPIEYATAGSLQHMQQPTGADTQVTTNGTVMSVRLHEGTYEVHPGTLVLAFDRPPVYLYNRSQVVASQAGTANWDNRTDFGLAIGLPARGNPGVISFINEGTLLPGPHRIDVDASVIGNPGIGFPGFDVEVTVGQDTLPMTLLDEATTKVPRRVQSLELDITQPLQGLWSVEFNWLNNLDVPAQGLFRDLAIHGYTLRRLAPRVYKVVSNAGSLQPIDVTHVPPLYGIPPGGLIATLSSSGTVAAWLHESQDSSRPEDDSFKSKLPLSELLTSATELKREDMVLLSYTGTLSVPTLDPPSAPSLAVSQSISNLSSTVWAWAGATTSTSINIKARVLAEGFVRAVVSKTLNFSTRIYSNTVYVSNAVISSIAGLGNNVASLDITGLEPNTTYYYAIGGFSPFDFDFSSIGTIKTWPEGQVDFSFAMSSAAATGSASQVFKTIQDAGPLFFLHMGDMHQAAISANLGASFQAAFESVLASSVQASLYRSTPLVYTWDERDYGPLLGDSAAPGKQAAQVVYRQYVPSYQLVSLTGMIYQAFTVGRVYFIVTDLRSARDPVGDPDTVTKTMMGLEQKAWFKRQLLDANGKYPLIIWVSSAIWVWSTGVIDDGWCKYTSERAELADFISSNGIKGLVIVSGNMHAIAADDGTNSNYASGGGKAGVPVLHAGAIDDVPSIVGGPYSEGVIAGTGQWALVTIKDSGSKFDINFSGRNTANEELLSFSFSSADSPKA